MNSMLTAVHFKNYRSLDDLSLENLTRINIIGGNNGVGKTSILEGVFSVLDRRGQGILRPFEFRQINKADQTIFEQLFFGLDKSKTIVLKLQFDKNKVETRITYSEPPAGTQLPAFAIDPRNQSGDSTRKNQGILVSTYEDSSDSPTDQTFLTANANGIIGTNMKSGTSWIPFAVFNSPITRYNPLDLANRYSKLRKEGKHKEVINLLKGIAPDVVSVELLQDMNMPALYAEMSNGRILPIAALGDGVKTLLSIILSITSLKNGILFIDEFESSIHYSKLPAVWDIIFKLSDEYNCQVFVVTHSLECLKAAAASVRSSQNEDCASYHRIERNKKGSLVSVAYNGQELKDALDGDWEVR